MPESQKHILLVEDEAPLREAIAEQLGDRGYHVEQADSGEAALARLADFAFDIIVTDLRLPGINGSAVLEAAVERYPDIVAIVVTGFGTVKDAVEAIKRGAWDFVSKPFQIDELLLALDSALEQRRLKSENAYLRAQLEERYRFEGLIGKSRAMKKLFQLLETVAPTNSTILITGETGTGKEVVARAIHHSSPRKNHRFVALNCSAIPETLLEAELFGHVRGAFTGAVGNRQGRFEQAHKGTLFLDEVGTMSVALQTKLLRALQEREFERIGDSHTIKVDVRVIAATNSDLAKMVADGQFREDLFYRLNVIPVQLPPLRERKEDIPLLAQHFLDKFKREGSGTHRVATPGAGSDRNVAQPFRAAVTFSQEAMRRMMAYQWPGNVRQLENAVERAVAFSVGRGPIDVADLPTEIQQAEEPVITSSLNLPEDGLDLDRFVSNIERDLIQRALERTNGNKGAAATLLGLKRTTLVEKLKRLTHVLVLALTAATAVFAQTPATQPGHETSAESVAQYALSDQMPMDPEATVGTLRNGLKYYIRPNPKPAQRVELRLVVKAGSVLEDDDQQGLAHFVEHMLFEGTRHFPRQSLNDFLASLGASIGPDANAATSFDETQYILRLPTDAPNVLDRALLVLEDWAQGALFEQAGIDRERGIVLSEWRMNLGAADRMQDKIRRAQLEGSRYADRPPIGKPDIIEKTPREPLVRFYNDWYRPDLMAVIVVGDINRDEVVSLINQHFSSLTNPSPRRSRPIFDVPERPGTRYTIATDKETTSTVVDVTDLRPSRNQGSVGGYRDIMKDDLFSSMLGARLDEVAHSANPPFLRADANRQLFPAPRTRDQASLEALVAADGVPKGLDALMTELQRVAQFGFAPTELARAKQAMMASSERATMESPDRESASRADEYTRNFLEGEALPTIWQELAFHKRFVPEITLAEVNALAGDWFPDENRLVIVAAPEAAGVKLPDQTALAAVVKAVAAKKLQPYVDTVTTEPLLTTTPSRGSIVKTAEREGGVTEWTLSNGATVVLKPTKLREDQVLFRAFAPGGESLASDNDLIPARVADMVVPAGGAGRFSEVTLDRMLAGKAINVTPYINEIDQGMTGGSVPQDLETMFQVMYLRFTAPRADPVAFAAMQSQARGMVANQSASPDFVFNETLRSILSQNSPRRQPETVETVSRWNLDRSLAFYKARFADASNFTFVFVGSFTVDQIKPFVETYVASLPATRAHEKWRDLGITPPSTVVEKTIEKGIAPKSQVAIVFNGPFDYDDQHRLALRTMTLLLESRLNDTIRQELGATYSITANADMQKFPQPRYTIRIEWTCDPARTPAVTARVQQEVGFVRSTTLSANQVNLIRELLLRDFEQNSQDNGYVLGQLARKYEDGEAADVGALARMPQRIAALTGDAIHDAAQRYLNPDRYVQVTLMPEGK